MKKKEELEQENLQLREELFKSNTEKEVLNSAVNNLQIALKNHADRVNQLETILRDAQNAQIIKEKYSDDSKFY